MNQKQLFTAITMSILGVSSQLNAQHNKQKFEFTRNKESECPKIQPGYNAPAAIDVKQCDWGDLSLSLSFLYWYVNSEGLGLQSLVTRKFIQPSFDYKPGFKLGAHVACGIDDWVFAADYMQLYSTVRDSYRDLDFLTSPFLNDEGQTVTIPGMQGAVKNHLNTMSAGLERPYFQGSKLTVTPFFGLQALWLRQVNHYSGLALWGGLVPFQFTGVIRSYGWAIGPRANISANWALGQGIRLETNMGGSILFTDYHKVTMRFTKFVSPPVGYDHYLCLRPIVEAGLGLGWGRYFCGGYHLDLVARYDFMLLMQQNMNRTLFDQYLFGSVTQNNLNLGGLTLNARFDF